MKEQIKSAIKTILAKYGLKAESIEKLVNIVNQRITAMGTVEPERLQEVIDTEVKAVEPFVGMIQSEVDSRVSKPAPGAKVEEGEAQTKPVTPPSDEIPEWGKKILEKNEELQQRLAAKEKEEAANSLKERAIALAKAKGADNEKLVKKAIRLVDIAEGETPDQVAQKLLSEYNELYATTSSEGAAPVVPSASALSAEELAKKRAEAAEKSSKELLNGKSY